MKVEKNSLRKSLRVQLRAVSVAERAEVSAKVFASVEALPAFCEARIVMCFWPLPDELDTIPFLNKWLGKKRIILPVVVGDDILLREYQGESSMREGAFGILEPTGENLTMDDNIDLIIVPGMAFAADGTRMGRGKGYYDRFLPKFPQAYKVGVGHKFQYFPALPTDDWDFRMDMVICG